MCYNLDIMEKRATQLLIAFVGLLAVCAKTLTALLQGGKITELLAQLLAFLWAATKLLLPLWEKEKIAVS
jgi:hypothetical protein